MKFSCTKQFCTYIKLTFNAIVKKCLFFYDKLLTVTLICCRPMSPRPPPPLSGSLSTHTNLHTLAAHALLACISLNTKITRYTLNDTPDTGESKLFSVTLYAWIQHFRPHSIGTIISKQRAKNKLEKGKVRLINGINWISNISAVFRYQLILTQVKTCWLYIYIYIYMLWFI